MKNFLKIVSVYVGVMQTERWLGFPIIKKKIKETMFIVRYEIKK
jgi:hypothetical protein